MRRVRLKKIFFQVGVKNWGWAPQIYIGGGGYIWVEHILGGTKEKQKKKTNEVSQFDPSENIIIVEL